MSDAPHSDEALERVAQAIRRISAVGVGRPIADEQLLEAAATLEVVASTLEAVAEDRKRPRQEPSPGVDPRRMFPTSPIIGAANPVAPPATLWAVDGEDGRPEIRGEVVFGYPYEGPPTCAHGGIIAELFDEMLGCANIVANAAGMTGTLTIKYRKPTPLMSRLDLVARHTHAEGRKSYAWGGIYHDGVLTAEAEGIFISMAANRILDIVKANAGEVGSQVVDAGFVELISQFAPEAE